jgi:NADPH:quinone reductase-like Zn-dependent oxidoreductase
VANEDRTVQPELQRSIDPPKVQSAVTHRLRRLGLHIKHVRIRVQNSEWDSNSRLAGRRNVGIHHDGGYAEVMIAQASGLVSVPGDLCSGARRIAQMKVIHLTGYGNPARSLIMVEVPEPNLPSAGQALVRMEYAPINFSDLLLANGVYFLNPTLPSVIGGEGAGIVEAIGAAVTSVKVGDRVTIPFGTFTWSEKILAPARGLFVVPPSVDAKTASMLNINPTTAVLLLDEFVKLKPEDWIVLNAANSQVARCVIAIAKSRDLNVIGIVRRSELMPEIEELGVDFVGLESPELSVEIRSASRGVPISLGLDAVGGPATATMANVLSPGAHLVSYAWLSGLPIQVPQGDLIGKRLNIHGFWMYYEEYLPKLRAALTEAAKVVASGKLSLPITTTYKPSQIKEAIEHSQRGGKILLDFN